MPDPVPGLQGCAMKAAAHLPATRRMAHADSRLPQILDAAARLFCTQGYQGTTVRDIAQAVGILPGSLYCHFATKDDLLAAVYRRGVAQICEALSAAIARHTEPWERLEAACVAHLQSILRDDDYARVVVRVRPTDVPAVALSLIDERNRYEAIWLSLVKALPLPVGTDRKTLRLMLLGALNWTPNWYRADGAASPRLLARQLIAMLKPHE
jgi:AcrR family transcriptional regulator